MKIFYTKVPYVYGGHAYGFYFEISIFNIFQQDGRIWACKAPSTSLLDTNNVNGIEIIQI